MLSSVEIRATLVKSHLHRAAIACNGRNQIKKEPPSPSPQTNKKDTKDNKDTNLTKLEFSQHSNFVEIRETFIESH